MCPARWLLLLSLSAFAAEDSVCFLGFAAFRGSAEPPLPLIERTYRQLHEEVRDEAARGKQIKEFMTILEREGWLNEAVRQRLAAVQSGLEAAREKAEGVIDTAKEKNEGVRTRQVTVSINDHRVAPDGRVILTGEWTGTHRDQIVIDVATGKRTNLGMSPASYDFRELAFSPSGELIAVPLRGTHRLALVPMVKGRPDFTKAREIGRTHGAYLSAQVAGSLDGKYWMTRFTTPDEIFYYDFAAEKSDRLDTTPVFPNKAVITDAGFVPGSAGESRAYFMGMEQMGNWKWEVRTAVLGPNGQLTQVTTFAEGTGNPPNVAWSADGKSVYTYYGFKGPHKVTRHEPGQAPREINVDVLVAGAQEPSIVAVHPSDDGTRVGVQWRARSDRPGEKQFVGHLSWLDVRTGVWTREDAPLGQSKPVAFSADGKFLIDLARDTEMRVVRRMP